MILCGIGDEAGNRLESQIKATQELGWQHLEARNIQMDGFPKANLHDLPEPAFEAACEALERSGIAVYCFGSTIMNWAKKVGDPFEITQAEVRRALPRLRRLNTRFIRIMSFKPEEAEERIPPVVLTRVREVVQQFADAGVQAVHENCMNYGGMSSSHARELLEAVPGLKWVFDTANPVFNPDRSQTRPWPRQDAWEFWTAVRDQVAHIHIKDARWVPAKNDADYTWPGEGEGAVERVVRDALQRGYAGAFSIEPHMVAVFHDAKSEAQDDALRENFVTYGRKLEELIRRVSPAGNPTSGRL